jgi:CRISPR-associated protein Cmr3
MNLICLKPSDNTFFGDGNQFKFDISNVLKSKNTPYPSAFFGAIFTAMLTVNDQFRRKFLKKGKYDHEKILEIKQVYLYNEETGNVYVKAPLDLFMKSRKEKTFGEFKNISCCLHSLNYDMIMYCPGSKDYIKASKKYININNIYDSYLKKQPLRIELIDEDEIFIKNYKVGIKIDKESRNVDEGMLYKIEQTEFLGNNWSYIVQYEIKEEYLKDKYNDVDIVDLESGYLKLGGENKVCKYNKIYNSDIEDFIALCDEEVKCNKFKIVLISDSYFKEDIDKVFMNNGLEIVGIVNDKPIYIGGYNMENKKAKSMYKGYPAGTVILARTIGEAKSIKGSINNEVENSRGFNRYVVMKGEF